MRLEIIDQHDNGWFVLVANMDGQTNRPWVPIRFDGDHIKRHMQYAYGKLMAKVYPEIVEE